LNSLFKFIVKILFLSIPTTVLLLWVFFEISLLYVIIDFLLLVFVSFFIVVVAWRWTSTYLLTVFNVYFTSFRWDLTFVFMLSASTKVFIVIILILIWVVFSCADWWAVFFIGAGLLLSFLFIWFWVFGQTFVAAFFFQSLEWLENFNS